VEGQVSRVTIIIIIIGQRWTVVIFVIVFVVGQRWTVFIVIFVIVFVVGSKEAGPVPGIIGQRCTPVIVIFIIVVVVVAAAWGTDFIGSTVGRWKNDDSRIAGPVQPGFSTGDSGAVGDTNGGPIVSDECRRGLQFQYPVTRGGTCDGISGTGLCTIDTNRAGR
jgi:hypothetical protein